MFINENGNNHTSSFQKRPDIRRNKHQQSTIRKRKGKKKRMSPLKRRRVSSKPKTPQPSSLQQSATISSSVCLPPGIPTEINTTIQPGQIQTTTIPTEQISSSLSSSSTSSSLSSSSYGSAMSNIDSTGSISSSMSEDWESCVSSSSSSSSSSSAIPDPFHLDSCTSSVSSSSTTSTSSSHDNNRNSNKDTTYVKQIKDWDNQNRMRTTISFVYEWGYHEAYLNGTQELKGSGGIIGSVANQLHLHKSHYNTVTKVVSDTIEALKNGERYEPFRKKFTCPERQKVSPKSKDMHLIAKLKENGNFRITTNLFNACIRAPLGLPPIGYTAIYNSIKKSNHKKVRTEKIHQASDRNLVWRQARFQSCAQFIARFGIPFPQGDTDGAELHDQKYVDIDMLEKEGYTYVLDQIAWWDEKHIVQVVGEHRDHTYQFGYDEYGKYSEEVEIEVLRKVSYMFLLYYDGKHTTNTYAN